MIPSKRSSLLVDHKVQVPLMLRVVGHWILMIFVMITVSLAGVLAVGSPASWEVVVSRLLVAFGPGLLASLVLLPILLFDCVRYTNRFAGPMVRLRRHAKQLAETGTAPRLQFREDDFWFELATAFNQVADRVEEGRRPESGTDSKAELCGSASEA